jgi:hypothetical protein
MLDEEENNSSRFKKHLGILINQERFSGSEHYYMCIAKFCKLQLIFQFFY